MRNGEQLRRQGLAWKYALLTPSFQDMAGDVWECVGGDGKWLEGGEGTSGVALVWPCMWEVVKPVRARQLWAITYYYLIQGCKISILSHQRLSVSDIPGACSVHTVLRRKLATYRSLLVQYDFADCL